MTVSNLDRSIATCRLPAGPHGAGTTSVATSWGEEPIDDVGEGGSVAMIFHERIGLEGRRISPFSWRIRYALAHQGLEPEVSPTCFADVATIERLSGQKLVPILEHDGAVISDSWAIASHLETRFPDRPSLFGGAAGRGLARYFAVWVDTTLAVTIRRLIAADFIWVLDPCDRAYYRRSREAVYGERWKPSVPIGNGGWGKSRRRVPHWTGPSASSHICAAGPPPMLITSPFRRFNGRASAARTTFCGRMGCRPCANGECGWFRCMAVSAIGSAAISRPAAAPMIRAARAVLRRPAPCDKAAALLLQSGGAPGSYQAGFTRPLHHRSISPTGSRISSGAIDAAIIAGNAPRERAARLRMFWDEITGPPSRIAALEENE